MRTLGSLTGLIQRIVERFGCPDVLGRSLYPSEKKWLTWPKRSQCQKDFLNHGQSGVKKKKNFDYGCEEVVAGFLGHAI